MDLPPRGQRAHAPDTWSRAKDDFLAGLSAPQVGERYGLSESTLRKRARAEGWRRADQPEPAAEPHPGEAADAEDGREPLPPADLLRLARLKMEDAVRAGRANEARTWARLHDYLRTLAAEARPRSADAQAFDAALDARSLRTRRKLTQAIWAEIKAEDAAERAPDAPDSPDPHPESSGAPAQVAARPAPNRAERRKRERLARWKAKQEARTAPPDD